MTFSDHCLPQVAAPITMGMSSLVVMWMLSIPAGHRSMNHCLLKNVPHPQLLDVSEVMTRSGLSFLACMIIDVPFHDSANSYHHRMSDLAA